MNSENPNVHISPENSGARKIWEETAGEKRVRRGGGRGRRGGGRGTVTETSSLMAGFFPNRTTQKEVRIARREAWRKVQRNSVQN